MCARFVCVCVCICLYKCSVCVRARVCSCSCLLPRAAATAAPAEAAGIGPLGVLRSGHAPPPRGLAQRRGLTATSSHGQLAASLGRDWTRVLQGHRQGETCSHCYWYL